MVSVAYSEAITEVLDILEHMEKQYIDKIPKKFREFLEKNKSKNYAPQLDHNKRINEMNLQEKTKDILAVIYRNYWCDNNKKMQYDELLRKNESNYKQEMQEKYSTDNLFKKTETKVETVNYSTLPSEVKEESFFKKIVNFIKRIFKK